MIAKTFRLATAILFGLAAAAQTADPEGSRVFHFSHTEAGQPLQEVANTIRSIGGIRDVAVDSTAMTVTVTGTPGQLAIAEWLFHGLDGREQAAAARQFKIPDAADDAVGVLYPTQARTSPAIMEINNILRAVGDLNRIYPCMAPGAIALRGSASQLAMARWLVDQVDKPDGFQPDAALAVAVHEYRDSDLRANVLRVFYQAHTETPQATPDLVNSIRVMADLNRVMASYRAHAIALRGTEDQAALAAWLVEQLDQPATGQRPDRRAHEYRLPGDGDNIVQVFHRGSDATAQSLQDLANSVRSATRMRRVYLCNQPKALLLRGQAEQMAAAEQLLAQQ